MTAQLRIVVLAIATATLLVPDLASSEPKRSYAGGHFMFSLDCEPALGDDSALRVVKASNWGRRYVGHDIALEVTEASRIRIPDRDNDGRTEFSDLRADDRVHVVAHVPESGDSSAALVAVRALHVVHPD